MKFSPQSVVLALIVSFTSSLSQQQDPSIKQNVTPAEAKQLERFESTIDQLREELKIPALSATIIRNQQVLWARGFGFADLEKKIPATEHTSYHLASLTKTFASNIVLNLVHDGKVNLDDPVLKYGIVLQSNGVIRVKHIFSHTSEGNPGERFRYSGSRYGGLDNVIEKTTGSTFGELVVKNVLEPLGMTESTPNAISALRVQPASTGDPATINLLKSSMEKLFQAYNNGDVEAASRFYSDAATEFASDGGFPEPISNLQSLRGLIKGGYKLNLETHNVSVAVDGSTAVVTCYYRGTVTPPNRHSRFDGPWRSTFVWTRQKDDWKIVHVHLSSLTESLPSENIIDRYQRILPNVAQPYKLDSTNQIVKGSYPTYFGTAAGMISSVTDMARYDIALDEHRILDEKTQKLAWSPTISTHGDTLPYGLGWFTTKYRGIKFVWHYGWWDCNSSLILKVPEKNLTFIVLANSDNLSRSSSLGSGDLLSSPVGLEFLEEFVFPDLFGERLPGIDWNADDAQLKKQIGLLSSKTYGDLVTTQLLNQARIENSVGQTDKAFILFNVYSDLHTKPLPHDLVKASPLARILKVGDNQDETVEFTTKKKQNVRIFAVGEGYPGQMSDYGWIEEGANGKKIWDMKEVTTTSAGGDEKNCSIDTVLALPAGTYKLRYKSDISHSYRRWNAVPPDYDFWGIGVYATE